MKMTALVSCHLSSDIKKKKYFGLSQAHLFRAHIFLTHLFWVSLLKSPFVLGFFYKYYLLLETYKSSVGSKKTTNENPTKKHGHLPFCHHRIMAGNTTWVHMGSEGISKLFNKTFWPLPWQLVYKKETPTTSEDRLIFSP